MIHANACRRNGALTRSRVTGRLQQCATEEFHWCEVRSGAPIMRIAGEERVENILGNSRRRHYSHAALLI